MRVLNQQKLAEIRGGFSLSASMLNSINNLVELLMEAGKKLGSAVRRMSSNQICPLE